MLEVAVEVGADDAHSEEGEHVLLTAPTALGAVAQSLREAGLSIASEKLVYLPQTPAFVTDEAVARQALRLHDQLDGYQDTLNVFTNLEVAEELLERLGD